MSDKKINAEEKGKNIRRRTVLGTIGSTVPLFSVLGEVAEAKIPASFSKTDITGAEVHQSLIHLINSDTGAIISESDSKYLIIYINPPTNTPNPSPSSFRLSTKNREIPPIGNTLRLIHGDGVKITHEHRRDREKYDSKLQVIDRVVFKLSRDLSLGNASLIIKDDESSFKIPIETLIDGNGMVGKPLKVESVNLPDEVGRSEELPIEFTVTNEVERSTHFYSVINVSGIWHACYPVMFEVAGSETLSKQISIPDIAKRGANHSGKIAAITSNFEKEQTYSP